MKSILFSGLFMVLGITLFAQHQEWAPIGAEWHYTHTYFVPPPPHTNPYYDYNRVVCTGDTLINGKNCRVLIPEKSNCTFWGTYTTPAHYTWQDSGKIYLWDAAANSFGLLMDFTKNAGEHWDMPLWYQTSYYADTVQVAVDSTDWLVVGGDSLKQLYVTYTIERPNNPMDPPFTHQDVIVERFGNLTQMLPIEGPLCDWEYDSGLRCYNDSITGLYTYVNYACDSIIQGNMGSSTTKVTDKHNRVKLYPNPAQNQLTIDFEQFPVKEVFYQIFTTTGRLVQQGNLPTNEQSIPIHQLSSGLFFLQVQTEEQAYPLTFFKE